VNAGAVHAYVLLPNGRTKYLSELRAGDEILAVRPDGDARAVLVGRVKIERRPLLLVEAESTQGNEHRSFSTLLQNAETVPLAGPKGPVPVTKAKPGDEVLVRLEAEGRGRHFGTAIRETITER
jgi:3-dehydroquinate synthase II